jgi:hypothetical protein
MMANQWISSKTLRPMKNASKENKDSNKMEL